VILFEVTTPTGHSVPSHKINNFTESITFVKSLFVVNSIFSTLTFSLDTFTFKEKISLKSQAKITLSLLLCWALISNSIEISQVVITVISFSEATGISNSPSAKNNSLLFTSSILAHTKCVEIGELETAKSLSAKSNLIKKYAHTLGECSHVNHINLATPLTKLHPSITQSSSHESDTSLTADTSLLVAGIHFAKI
jgi:hypothetical protein